MPKKEARSEIIHLWVKQGKTDHMATLDDPVVFSKLKEKRDEMSSSPSFSITSLSITDLIDPEKLNVGIRWTSTNAKDNVESSSVRFRDMEAEGRGSKRGERSSRQRQATQTTQPQAPIVSKKRKRKAVATKSVDVPTLVKPKSKVASRKQNRNNESGSTYSSTSFSISDFRDDDDTLDSSVLNPSTHSLEGPGKTNENDMGSSHSSKEEPKPMNFDDEDFDSSDDEAIVMRMKRKKELAEARKIPRKGDKVDKSVASNNSKFSMNGKMRVYRVTGRPTEKKKRSRPDDDSANISNSGRQRKKKKSAEKMSIGTFSSDEESDYNNSAYGSYKKVFDSDEDDSGVVSAEKGQTNTTNWLKMKTFFKNFV